MWKRCFANGLGSQANGELMLWLAPGAKRFCCCARIDNTFDTARSQEAPIVENGP
jgi:hypothetical protein